MSEKETKIPVQVTITNEQIDKAIIDSLVGTNLGQQIAKEIETCFGTGYGKCDMGRIVKGIVETQIRLSVENILLTTHHETIKTFVTEKMTEEYVNELFEKMWERWQNR